MTERPLPRVGVALSGGGYRAAAWALGSLRAIVAAGLGSKVTMISSVSGGSITNAYLGLREDALATPGRFDDATASLEAGLAGHPVGFMCGLFAHAIVIALVWYAAATDRTTVLGVAAVIAVVIGIVAGLASGDLLFGRARMWWYVSAGFGGGGALIVLVDGWPVTALAVVAVGAVLMYTRGPVVGNALGASTAKLCDRSGPTLGDLPETPVTVICATELHAGHQLYLAHGFAYCYDFGLGQRDNLSLATAVQASANLPGAFPTRWLRAAPFGFRPGSDDYSWLGTSDGGVYDNMADQWLAGLTARMTRLRRQLPADDAVHKTLKQWSDHAPTLLVVANASGALSARKLQLSAVPVIGELVSLLHVKDVLYDNGNSVRREWLVERFDSGAAAGTLVHIATNPYALAHRLDSTPATAWLDHNGVAESEWTSIAQQNTTVGTKLWPLGRNTTRRLVDHAFALTTANLIARGFITPAEETSPPIKPTTD
ncbi:MAG: hypothetical protein QOI95_83 [Acidimicrobiaceae bacterium]|jgi:predicted acylesterase/phospholipase RssA